MKFTPGECGIIRLQSQQTAGGAVAVLVIMDDCGSLQQELVNIWL